MSHPIEQDPSFLQMAQLLNYDSPSELADSSSTEDANDLEAFHHPEDEPTPRRFSQKGSTKLLFVAGGVLTLALVLGGITNQIFRPQSTTSTTEPRQSYEEQDSLTLSLNLNDGAAELATDEEMGVLRTEVALKNQAHELEDLEASLGALADDSEAISPESETATQATAPAATPQPAAAPPPRITPQPATPPVAQAPRPIVASSRTTQDKPSPWDEWKQLAAAGTLGQVQTVAHQQTTTRTPVTRAPSNNGIGPARTVTPSTQSQNRPVTRINPSQGSTTVSQNTSPSLGTYLNGHEPIPGLRHPARGTLAIGTTATATVSTPILWPGEGTATPASRAPNTPKYIVTLDEALTSAEGHIVFPRAAPLVVTVAPLDVNSGIATLDVLAVIRDNQAYQIPPGQLQIRGADGMPLVAQRFNDPGRSIFAMDAGLFVISGLANLGTILNRPRSSTVVTSEFQGTIANEYNDPNFVGAVLEGGAGALAERLSARNEQAIQELAQRPTTWYLPQGTTVQLFVNQPLRI